MEIPRQYYTEEFKQEAVKLIPESGLKLSEAAHRLNIPSQTLKNWLYRDKTPDSTASSRKPLTDLEAEVSRLRKELAESRLEAANFKNLQSSANAIISFQANSCHRPESP